MKNLLEWMKWNWDFALIVLLIVLTLASLTQCNSFRSDIKMFKSKTSGIQRTIILYNANGGQIKTWNTTSLIHSDGSGAWFLNENENYVEISGTYIIEEKTK